MYTIVIGTRFYPIDDRRVAMNVGMARDLLTHARFEPSLRVVAPAVGSLEEIKDAVIVDRDEVPNMSFGFLPYTSSSRKSWVMNQARVREALIREARAADVWHTVISRNLWDLASVSFEIGRKYATGLRVFVMDSDPAAMLRSSGGLSRWKSVLVRRRLIQRLRHADLSIFVGQGVHDTYGRYARQSATTSAVWLMKGDLADPGQVAEKFQDVRAPRLVLPTRLTAWKGVDDAIRAVAMLGDRCGPFTLDVVGDGPCKNDLIELARREGVTDRVRFLDPQPYGEPFFRFLRGYHMVLAPTRAMEEVRIIYDALASGCVLAHSATRTLNSALENFATRWSHEPADPRSLAEALTQAMGARSSWGAAAAEGLNVMAGRTIDEMHRIRAEVVSQMRAGSPRSRTLEARPS